MIRKLLIFITGYAWVGVLLGVVMIGTSVYSNWKAEGDHAYTAREQLTTVSGKVAEASEVTVKRRRGGGTKHYYQINVAPEGGGEVQKLRISYTTPKELVASLIDEKVTVLADKSDNDMVYDVTVGNANVIKYEETKQRLLAEAKSAAASNSGMWGSSLLLIVIGALGVWFNRKLRAAEDEE